MKNLFYVICVMLCLVSCVESKYRLQCKTFDNELIVDTVIVTSERFSFKGRDTRALIETKQINCLDTFYVFYFPTINYFSGSNQLTEFQTIKPLGFISLTYIEN